MAYSGPLDFGAWFWSLELHLHHIGLQKCCGRQRKSGLALPAVCFLVATGIAAARAEPQPAAAMLQPVSELVEFMRALPPAPHPRFFAHHLCIIENFAPFLFCGPKAALRWETGFRAHSGDEKLSELAVTFGEAHDYSRSGKRVYFSLPTTWTGRTNGRSFEEHGAWAFILSLEAGSWRIAGYGWGVSAYSENSP